MSDDPEKAKKHDHGHGDLDHDVHEGAEPFVPEDSLYDWALVGLSVVAAIGIVGLMGIWMLLPLPEVESSANTPTVEGGVSKP